MPYRFQVLTLFPDMLRSPLETSILKRATDAGLVEVSLHDIREHATDRHRTADDVPFGGGGGMVMKAEPLVACIEQVRQQHQPAQVLLLSPSGRRFDQQMAGELAALASLALVCGHYEGIDERVSRFVDGEVSIGDYVLTGGELAAMVIIDAVARLQAGVLGNEESPREESHTGEPLLEYPQYTRPRELRGLSVPDVLLSGHHAAIARWRRRESIRRTIERRPDLWRLHRPTALDLRLLDELRAEGLLPEAPSNEDAEAEKT